MRPPGPLATPPNTALRLLAGATLGAIVVVIAIAGTATAQVRTDVDPPDQIVLSGRVDVPRGRTVGQVVVFRGTANVQGVALGDVVVLSGRVTISGQVGGSVVNLDGPVTIAGSAQVRGDVIGRQEVAVREGAQIEGQVRSNVPLSLRGPLQWVGAFAAWLAVTISSLVLGLLLLWLVPRANEVVLEVAREAPLPSAGWGLAWLVGAPIVAILTMLTLVALPLGLTFLLALAFFFSVGHAWSAWIVGRLLLPDKGQGRSRYVAFLAGLGILRVVGAIPWAGGMVWVLGGAFGLGAATVAVWRWRGVGGKHRPGRARTEPVPQDSPAPTAGPPRPEPKAPAPGVGL